MSKDTLMEAAFKKIDPDLKTTETPVEEFKAFIKFQVKIGFWTEEDARAYISRITNEIFEEIKK